jgi:Cation transport protein
LNDPVVTSLPPFQRFIDGLFQASSTRTAGFAVVNLAELHPGIQVSYLIMMYISVLPIAISMRRTNVYEEKSLGIYAGEAHDEDRDPSKEPSYVGAHLRNQLSFDLWYIFLGMFLIACVEGHRLQNTNEYAFTLFSVLFEIISAYGTVGLSLGYPTINSSFCTEFKTFSRLVIVAMQIRGRHRGLPYELDRAVLLPSESLQEREHVEAQKMITRRRTSLTSGTSRGGMSRTRPGAPATPFSPFSPSPLRSDNAIATGSEGNGVTERMAIVNSDGTEKATEKHTGPVRSGLGNAMFKLASPTHRRHHDRDQTEE